MRDVPGQRTTGLQLQKVVRYATCHGIRPNAIFGRPSGDESRGGTVVEWMQLETSRVSPICGSGQHILHEKADIAAAQDQIERQASRIARPPTLQSAGQACVGFRSVLVLVKNDQQRTGPGHACQVGKRRLPVRQRRRAQPGIILNGENRGSQISKLVRRRAFDRLIQHVALSVREFIEQGGLANTTSAVNDPEFWSTRGIALVEPGELVLAIEKRHEESIP